VGAVISEPVSVRIFPVKRIKYRDTFADRLKNTIGSVFAHLNQMATVKFPEHRNREFPSEQVIYAHFFGFAPFGAGRLELHQLISQNPLGRVLTKAQRSRGRAELRARSQVRYVRQADLNQSI
jgi:hypothetical protein